MTARLVALDEGSDIVLDRAMVVVGRHPACDARLDSLRVSRHHCCMMQEAGEIIVRDLGSTNGIRINGQRVEMGRLRPGDELSIAHIRFRFDHGQAHDQTIADPAHPVIAIGPPGNASLKPRELSAEPPGSPPQNDPPPHRPDENALAAAVRRILPSSMAEKCQIQVIVQMTNKEHSNGCSVNNPSPPAPPQVEE